MISAGLPRSFKDKLTVLLRPTPPGSARRPSKRHRQAPRLSAMLRRWPKKFGKGSCVPGRKAGMKVLPSRPDIHAESAPARKQAAAMIEIDRVSQIFRTSGRRDHLALSEISLTIEDGAFVSILGPSGCGKSTLLYIVGGFVNPTGGVAKGRGKAITGPGPDRGPGVQEFALFPSKSVRGTG